MTGINLKPCPCCGSTAAFNNDGDGANWIECTKQTCGLSTMQRWSLMDSCHPQLAQAWNSRARPPTTSTPFLVGIQRQDGTAYIDDLCVSTSWAEMEALAEGLNRDSELSGGPFDHYAAVPLYPGNDPFLVAARVGISQAAQDVLAERRRQMDVEGWAPEHDDHHALGDLSLAAALYAVPYNGLLDDSMIAPLHHVLEGTCGWKLKPEPDDRRRLVKAGALIVAEIERLDRASATGSPEGHTTEGAEVQP